MDLATHVVQLIVNGETLVRGSGAAVLGHPLNPLTWLANKLREKGQGLKSGDLVSTGVSTGIYLAVAGDQIVADFGTIGQVELSFSRSAGLH